VPEEKKKKGGDTPAQALPPLRKKRERALPGSRGKKKGKGEVDRTEPPYYEISRKKKGRRTGKA